MPVTEIEFGRRFVLARLCLDEITGPFSLLDLIGTTG
jgi:hypothetical protein